MIWEKVKWAAATGLVTALAAGGAMAFAMQGPSAPVATPPAKGRGPAGAAGDQAPASYASFRAHKRAVLTWYTSATFEQLGAAMAFSPDSASLATAGEDGTVKVWDAADGSLQAIMRHEDKVEYVAFAPDGRMLFAEGHGSIPMLFAADGAGDMPPPPGVPGAAVKEPPRSMATFWELPGGKAMGEPLAIPPRVAGRREGMLTLQPPPDDADPRLMAWDVSVRRGGPGLWARLPQGEPGLISHDGATVAWSELGAQVRITDAATGRDRVVLTGSLFRAATWAFSADGRWFASGSWGGAMALVDLKSLETRIFPTPERNRTPLAFSPDGKLLASVGVRAKGEDPVVPDDEIVLREAATGRVTATLRGHHDVVTSIIFSPDGRRLATADWDGNVRLWDVP